MTLLTIILVLFSSIPTFWLTANATDTTNTVIVEKGNSDEAQAKYSYSLNNSSPNADNIKKLDEFPHKYRLDTSKKSDSYFIFLESFDYNNYVFKGWKINNDKIVLEYDAFKTEGLFGEGYTEGSKYGSYINNKRIPEKAATKNYFLNGIESELYVNISKNKTAKNIEIEPVFEKINDIQTTHKLTIQQSDNGKVRLDKLENETWVLRALPDDGYVFKGWQKNDETELNKEENLQVTLESDTTYKPIFGAPEVTFEYRDGFNIVQTSENKSTWKENLFSVPAMVGERALFKIPITITSAKAVIGNYNFEIYEGTKTTGKPLATYQHTSLEQPKEDILVNILVDPVPAAKEFTVVGKVNDGDIVTKTYNIDFPAIEQKELMYLTTPNDKFLSNVATLDPGPNIYDVATFLDEATGKRSVYAAALGGVLELQGREFTYMPGLDLKTGDNEGNAGLVLGIGGTKDHLLAFVQDSEKSGVSTLLSYAIYEYTKELGEWRKVQNSEITKDSLKPKNFSAYITNKNEIWTDRAHWNGEKWQEHNYDFSAFKKLDGTTAYASGKGVVYFYENNEWKEIKLNLNTTNTPNLQNITTKGELLIHLNQKDYKVSKDSTVEELPEVRNQITTNIYNRTSIDSNGDLYAFPSTRKYTAVGTSGYTGSSVYKYDNTQKKWIYQHIAAFTAPDDFAPDHADYLTKKKRPNGVETIYILQDNMNLFVGAGGAVYADFGSSTIKFNSKGGTPVGDITGNIGADIPNIPTPVKAEEYFAGWYSDAALTKPYHFDFMPAKDTTLYAKWTTSTIDLSKEMAEAVAALETYAKQFKSYQYEGDNYQKVLDARDAGIKAIKSVKTSKGDITNALNQAKKAIEAIPQKNTVTVAVTMEKFTLGQGYIIEPVLVTVPKDTTPASKVITDLLKKKYPEIEQPWKMTGKVEDTFYLSHVYDTDYDYSNFPEYVKKAVAERGGDFTLERKKDWLGEFDFYNMSGWMYAINNNFPGVGAAAWTLKDRQVMRWQYTVFGYGADLNADNSEWGTASIINTARKDDLIWRIAEINNMEDKAAFLTKGDNQKHYDEAMKVLQIMDTPEQDITRLVAALGGEETEEEETPEMPDAAKVIDDAIKSLPTKITLADEANINQIRKDYNALDDIVKQWIWKDELATLENAEKTIIQLKQEVQDVVELIDKLPQPNKVVSHDAEFIRNVEARFEKLSKEQQALVQNRESLLAVIVALEKLVDDPFVVKVMDLINQLPSAKDITLAAQLDVARARASYDMLAKSSQLLVTNYTKLVEAEIALETLKGTSIESIIMQIDLLPKTVTLADELRVLGVQKAYEALPKQQQQQVTNIQKLLTAIEQIEALKKPTTVTEIIKQIDSLPNIVQLTLLDEAAVTAVRAKYDALSMADKQVVINSSKLIEVEIQLKNLLNEVRVVMNEIDSLPQISALRLSDESLIKRTRSAYDKLQVSQKAAIKNYPILTAAEAQLEKLLLTQNDRDVQAIEANITRLPSISHLTLSDEPLIHSIRLALNQLTSEQRAKVKNIQQFDEVERALLVVKTSIMTIIDELSRLPNVDKITLNDEKRIKNIRETYENLNATNKKEVWNYSKLEEAEKRIALLNVTPQVQAINEAINALPSLASLQVADEAKIRWIRAEYDALTAQNKAKVLNYMQFVNLEMKLQQLLNEKDIPKDFAESVKDSVGIKKVTQDIKNNSIYLSAEEHEDIAMTISNKLLVTAKEKRAKKIIVGNEEFVEITLPLKSIQEQLSKDSELLIEATPTKVNHRKAFTITLQEKIKGNLKRDIILTDSYIEVTIPLATFATLSKQGAILRVENGQYFAVPHRIEDNKVIILANANDTYIYSSGLVTFADIANTGYEDDIEALASRYIINGVNGEFKPNATITRAHFGAMISRALNLQAKESTQYYDIRGEWYEKDIQALYEAGITQSTGLYNPNAQLTREQAAAFMYRILTYMDATLEPTKRPLRFADQHEIRREFLEAVTTLQELGIMQGKNGNKFDPQGKLTRGQMAKILRKTLEQAKAM